MWELVAKRTILLLTIETTINACTKDLRTMGDVGELIMLPVPLFLTNKGHWVISELLKPKSHYMRNGFSMPERFSLHLSRTTSFISETSTLLGPWGKEPVPGQEVEDTHSGGSQETHLTFLSLGFLL